MKKHPFLRAALWAAAALVALSALSLAEPAERAASPENRNAVEIAPTLTKSNKKKASTPDGILPLDRSNVRSDYPHLTDAEYANFRNVATTGMGINALYRSSSPINPRRKRNRQADAALHAAKIRTVLNLADTRDEMEAYAGYADSHYSRLDVIPLGMSPDYLSKSFRKGLAQGCRYIIDHEGPYLIHCTLGRDRTGIACAVLECLMGATADEVAADYMLTYYYYYGIQPGTESYTYYLQRNIGAELATIYGIGSFYAEHLDLARCAEDYLLGLGLTPEEINALKARLGADIPQQ